MIFKNLDSLLLHISSTEEQKTLPELNIHDIKNLSALLECPELLGLKKKHQHDCEMEPYKHVETLKPQVMLQVIQVSM